MTSMGASEQDRETLVQMLIGLQTGCDERYARQVLQKHDWNADQAAAALLDMVTANEQQKKYGAGTQRQGVMDEWVTTGALNAVNPTPARPNSVIDLTGDDDEDTAKAIEASMETQPMFGPSNRVDDTQQWAMVPSNAPPALSQEDQALNRALEASLSSSFVGAAQESYEEPSDPVERVRKDGWPTALRITNSTLCHVPIVLQCLLSLPKVYNRIMKYQASFPEDEEQLSLSPIAVFAQQFQRLAAIFTHTTRAYVIVDDLLDSLGASPPISNQHPLPGLIRDYYTNLANQLELVPRNEDDLCLELPLMVFQGGNADADINELSSTYASGFYIDVFVPSPSGNDMVSCLAHSFLKTDVCLSQLSECLAFVVHRQDDMTVAGTERAPLRYPVRLYLDRFMRENAERATELRNCQEGMHHEIQKLATDRHKLSNWKNEDTLKALRSSVHYFEHLANDFSQPLRKAANEQSKLKLLGVIKQIEVNIHYLDARIKELTADAEALFDKPDLQQHGYDLCAVIMHDGLFGRNHVYSYTKDEKGNWWKIVDYQVSEATEDMVLNDHTGLHLGAGPMLLLYSRASSIDPALQEDRQPRWPRVVRDLVQEDNVEFLAELPPEVASLFTGTLDTQPPFYDNTTSLPVVGTELLGMESTTRVSVEREAQVEVTDVA